MVDLLLSYRRRSLTVAGRTIRLSPADFAFYALHAKATVAGRFVNYRTPGFADEYLNEYGQVMPVADEDDDSGPGSRVRRRVQRLDEGLRTAVARARKLLEAGRDVRRAEEGLRYVNWRYRNWFSERKAKVNRALRTGLGDQWGSTCKIVARGRDPKTGTLFGVGVDPLRIHIED